jgi:hypothetical protein
MPFITISGGLTLKVPTRGTTDWDTEFLNEFATPISNHTHTGSGDGAQLGAGSIQDDSMDDRKIRLRTNEYLRSRNNAGSGDVNLIKANASDEIELDGEFWHDGERSRQRLSLANNQASAAATGLSLDASDDKSLYVHYRIDRQGTGNLHEEGHFTIVNQDGAYSIEAHEYVGEDAGIDFSMNANSLEYTSTDNPGSTTNYMF